MQQPYRLYPLLRPEGLPKLLNSAMGEFGSEAVAPLCAALKDPNKNVRQGAVALLTRINDPSAIDSLVETLNDKDRFVRRSAVLALGAINNPRVVDPLLTLLKDPAIPFKGDVIKALRGYKDPRTIEPLIAVIRKSASWQIAGSDEDEASVSLPAAQINNIYAGGACRIPDTESGQEEKGSESGS
jgi:HEAT repeat protein